MTYTKVSIPFPPKPTVFLPDGSILTRYSTKLAPNFGEHIMLIVHFSKCGITLFTSPSGVIRAKFPCLIIDLLVNKSLR